MPCLSTMPHNVCIWGCADRDAPYVHGNDAKIAWADADARHRCGAVARVSHHVQIDGRERQSECEGVEHDDDRQAPTDGVSGRQPSHHATEDTDVPWTGVDLYCCQSAHLR